METGVVEMVADVGLSGPLNHSLFCRTGLLLSLLFVLHKCLLLYACMLHN